MVRFYGKKGVYKYIDEVFDIPGAVNSERLFGVPEVEELIAEAGFKMETFCKLFLPDLFSRDFDPPYYEMFEVLDDETLHKVAIKGPRGIGKTSIFSVAKTLQTALYMHASYIVPILSTKDDTLLRSEEIKDLITNHRRIRTIFGAQETSNYSKQIWETTYGCGILPRSPGMQTRGIRFKGLRPGLIIIDDVERSATGPEQRKKLKRWGYTDVFNAVDIYQNPRQWRILMIGTMLNTDGLLASVFKDPEFTTVHLKLWKKNYVSNFPKAMSTIDVKRLVNSYVSQGMERELYQEFQGIIRDDAKRSFDSECLPTYSETDPEFICRKDMLETMVLCDPARSIKNTSAFTAIMTVSFDRERGKVYVRCCFNSRVKPDGIYQELYRQCEFYGINKLGLETEGLEEFILQPVKDFFFQKDGRLPQITKLPTRGGNFGTLQSESIKLARIWGLLPYCKNGHIYFNVSDSQTLREQLLDMPDSNPIDLADLLSHIIFVFSLKIIALGRNVNMIKGYSGIDYDKNIDRAMYEFYNKKKRSMSSMFGREMSKATGQPFGNRRRF